MHAVSLVTGRAFAGAQGLIAVNQGSGRANLQINAVAIALGISGVALAESELSQSRSDSVFAEDFEPNGARVAQVSAEAFQNAAGVIQFNQVAGVANTTFNRFGLSVIGGGSP